MKEKDTYKSLAMFYAKKEKEQAGGGFFTVYHHKAVLEQGVWARSKKELIDHYNKIRRHFTHIDEQSA